MARVWVRYEDVTGRPGPEPPYPELVAELEELGYRQVGLVVATLEPIGNERLAAGYAPSVRAEMLANLPRPTTVLRSPDDTSLVDVAWFWGWPDVTFSTAMADGSLVETRRRWDGVPPWPRSRGIQHRFATVEGEMTREASRGRSVAVAAGGDPASLDEAHRAHVAAYADVHGTEVLPAPGTMARVIAHRETAWAHTRAVSLRYRTAGTVVVNAPGLVGAMVVAALLFSGRPAAALVAATAFWATALLLGPWLAVRLAYVRWWRPPYRAGRYDVPRSSRTQTGSPQASTP